MKKSSKIFLIIALALAVVIVGGWVLIRVLQNGLLKDDVESGLQYRAYVFDKTCVITGRGTRIDTEIAIPDTIGNYRVTGIENGAFRNCDDLTKVTIPDSVTKIGYGAFAGCSNLESITLPFVGKSGDTYEYPFGYIFGEGDYTGGVATKQKCYGESYYEEFDTYYIPSNLKLVTITRGNIIDGIIGIGQGAFYGCSSLMSITISDSVKLIDNKAFYDCSNLASVTIGNGVTRIGGDAFYNCSSLTSITIPDGITDIGSSAFQYCSSLTSITIPDSVTDIGSSAFQYCSSLTSIEIPDNVVSIGGGVFYGCRSLANVQLGNGITGFYIRETMSLFPYDWNWYGMFAECSSLTSITIPNSVTNIAMESFYNCKELTSITFEGTVAQWNTITFGTDWNFNVPATEVICADGIVPLN